MEDMSIPEQDKLINDMIKEDRHSTIKDFIELKQEILNILSAPQHGEKGALSVYTNIRQ